MILKKFLLGIATVMLTIGMAMTALAAGNFSVKADELEYNLNDGTGSAKGHVVVVQDGGRATADYAEFNSKQKTATFTGNVILDKDGSNIVCEKLIMYNENNFSAIGGAVIRQDGRILEAEQIDYDKAAAYASTAGSWARLTDVDGSVMSAAKIEYNIKDNMAQATGGVNINSDARQLEAYADKVIYETKNNGYVELIGNARATQNGNSVEGDKLRLFNKSVAQVDGNVKIIYFPEEKTALAASGDKELA